MMQETATNQDSQNNRVDCIRTLTDFPSPLAIVVCYAILPLLHSCTPHARQHAAICPSCYKLRRATAHPARHPMCTRAQILLVCQCPASSSSYTPFMTACASPAPMSTTHLVTPFVAACVSHVGHLGACACMLPVCDAPACPCSKDLRGPSGFMHCMAATCVASRTAYPLTRQLSFTTGACAQPMHMRRSVPG